MKPLFMRIIYLVLLLAATNTALAEDVGYEVEVIIFEDTTGNYKHSEKWPEPIATEENNTEALNTTETDTKIIDNSKTNKIEATETIDTEEIKETESIVFGDIEKENYRLSKQAKKLEEHSDYRILVHKAWKQPGLDKENALPMEISNFVKSEDPNSVIKSYIDGDITLIMSRYLHINTNLIFHKSKPALLNTYKNIENDIDINFKDYPLIFERRMRSKEIHYIDHPLIGIIVLAIPFKIEEKETPQQETYKTIQ